MAEKNALLVEAIALRAALVKSARGRLGNQWDAEDLVQNLMVEVLRVKSRAARCPQEYVRGIARNMLAMAAKRRIGAPALLPLELEDEPVCGSCEASIDLERLLCSAVQILTARQAEALQLALLGHECAEIAAELGCSANTAEKHIGVARRRLRAFEARQ
jgi:RNA polymerase sigma factor (sigma-70 family)